MGSIQRTRSQKRDGSAYLFWEVIGEAISEPNLTHLSSVQNGTNMIARQVQNGTKMPGCQNGTNLPKDQPNASFAGGGTSNYA